MRRIVFDQDEDEDESGGEMTAAEWRALREALTDRVARLVEERDQSSDDASRAKLQTRIDEARRQIQALAVEETVTKFTEDSERYIIAAGTMTQELSRDPDEEIA